MTAILFFVKSSHSEFSKAKSLTFFTNSNVGLYSHVKKYFYPVTVINVDL